MGQLGGNKVREELDKWGKDREPALLRADMDIKIARFSAEKTMRRFTSQAKCPKSSTNSSRLIHAKPGNIFGAEQDEATRKSRHRFTVTSAGLWPIARLRLKWPSAKRS
jgi:hypothetical protein